MSKCIQKFSKTKKNEHFMRILQHFLKENKAKRLMTNEFTIENSFWQVECFIEKKTKTKKWILLRSISSTKGY